MTPSLRGRAVAAGFLALLATVASAGPASAAAPRVTFLSPNSGQQLGASNPTLTARVEMSNGALIDQITMSVVQLEVNRPPVTGSTAAASSPQTVEFPLNLAYNGRYRASVTARGRDQPIDLNGPESATSTMEFAVAAPPERPTDVKTAVDASTRAVAVTWKANPEPDLLFYVVQRAKGTSNDFTVLGQASETTYIDSTTTSAGGDYRYQVVAVRNGVRADEGISSDPSALTAATTARVPDPPPPPTTAPPSTTASTGTGTPASAVTTASSVPASSPGALTSSGTVDLSGFNAVRSQTPRPAVPRTVALPDPGFQATLPFDTESTQAVEDAVVPGDLGELAADSPELRELGDEDSSADRFRTLAFFAAGLLATVLLMHVLWVKSEIRRVPLEALDPEGPLPTSTRLATPRKSRFASKGPGTGPKLEDIESPDFEPVVVSSNGKGGRHRAGGSRRQKVSTGA